MPEVSVIIPNYNHADYLKLRINSVLNQTFTDFEVIILDDCSADNSRQIIEQYKPDSRISNIIYNETNSGSTFKQWEKGIQLAKGEYIWIAESDDWCENNFLETIVTGIKKENVAFGYCQSICVNNKSDIIFQSGHSRLEDYYSADKFLEHFLCFGNAVYNASMAVFKKSFYSKISETYKLFRFAGDRIFWAELSRLGDVFISGKLLNYFKKHNKDVSSKMYSSGFSFIEEIKVLDYFHEQLQLNSKLYFKAKVKLYTRFLSDKTDKNSELRKEVRTLIFKNISFMQKTSFLIISRLYQLKNKLKLIIN